MFRLFFLAIFVLVNRWTLSTTSFADAENGETEIRHLPDNVVPLNYELWMTPNLSSATFEGNIDVTIAVVYATYVIKLHSKNLKIKKTQLRNLNKKIMFIDNTIRFDHNNDLLLIITQEKALPGLYVLSLAFEGVLNDDLVGFYRSSYTVNNEIKWLAITQFEPNHAREAFPCFDEPRFKTPFIINLARYAYQTTRSNMPRRESKVDRASTSDKRIWDTYEPTPAIPTHLVAFVVSELTASTAVSTSTCPKIRLHSTQNVVSNTQYFLKQSEKLLKEITDFIGVKCGKIDFIAVPDLKPGATHHLGMPTFREIYTVVDEESCAEIQKIMATLAASHMIACHWFASPANLNWWDSAWIVRGLAIYFEYFLSAKIEPTWNLEEHFIFEEVQSTLWAEIEYQRAMTSEITKLSELESLYSVVSGDKAACIFRMLETIIETEGFKCGLKEYLENGKNLHEDTAPSKVLFQAFEEQTCHNPELPPGISLSQILRTWTDNIGFPLITVTKNPDTGKWKIEQTTYKSPRAPESLPDQEWIVPVTCTTKSRTIWNLWSIGSLPTEPKEVVQTSDWVLCNFQQTGYYRVNYDDTNWNLLIKQLNENKDAISVVNRAQLVDDSFALAFDRKLSYAIPLQLAKYLKTETHLLPWLSATFHFDLILSEYWENYKSDVILAYIKNLVKTILISNTPETHLYKVSYPVIASVACKLGMNECVDKVLTEWNTNKEDLDKINPDLQGLVFCTILGTVENPREVWNKLWSLYKTTNLSYLKTLILSKLGCATDEDLLKNLLEKLINPDDKEIKSSDKNFVINSFLRSPSTIKSFLNFLKELLPEITTLNDNAIVVLQSLALNLETKKLFHEHFQQLQFLKCELDKLKENRFEVLKKSISNSYAHGIWLMQDYINRIIEIENELEKIKDP